MQNNKHTKFIPDNLNTPQPTFTPTYRNLCWTIGFVMNASLGWFFFAYVMASVAIIPTQHIIRKFHIQGYKEEVLTGILAGIVPIGGIFGSWASRFAIKLFSRRNALIMTSLLAILGTLLVLVPKLQILVIGRTLQGFCLGLYSPLVPLITNEMAPIDLNGAFGMINQLFIVVATATPSVFALFINSDPNQQISPMWRFIYGFPLISIIIQILLLLFVFKEETPRYLLENGRQFQAFKLIRYMYEPQSAEQVFEIKLQQLQTEKNALQKEELSVVRTQSCVSRRTVVAFHIALLNQMCGASIVIVYGTYIMNHTIKDIHTAKMLQIPLNGIQIILTLLSSMPMQMMNRKKLIQTGTAMSTFTLLMICIGFLEFERHSIQQRILVIGSLFIFMACFRLTLGSVTWVYITQIASGNLFAKATVAKWMACCVLLILFPIIGKAINPGYLFLFLAGWGIVSLIINHLYIVETKGQSKEDIAKGFIESG